MLFCSSKKTKGSTWFSSKHLALALNFFLNGCTTKMAVEAQVCRSHETFQSELLDQSKGKQWRHEYSCQYNHNLGRLQHFIRVCEDFAMMVLLLRAYSWQPTSAYTLEHQRWYPRLLSRLQCVIAKPDKNIWVCEGLPRLWQCLWFLVCLFVDASLQKW
jgi:hypothetical protein